MLVCPSFCGSESYTTCPGPLARVSQGCRVKVLAGASSFHGAAMGTGFQSQWRLEGDPSAPWAGPGVGVIEGQHPDCFPHTDPHALHVLSLSFVFNQGN